MSKKNLGDILSNDKEVRLFARKISGVFPKFSFKFFRSSDQILSALKKVNPEYSSEKILKIINDIKSEILEYEGFVYNKSLNIFKVGEDKFALRIMYPMDYYSCLPH